MILSQKALEKIRDKGIRRDLGEALDVVDQVILMYIRKNKVNGPLTTYKALQVIKENTGFEDEDILVDEKDTVPTK